MQTLFQHCQSGQIRHRVPFQGASDRCPIDSGSPSCLPQTDPQILNHYGQGRRNLLRVMHMNRCIGSQSCRRPLARFNEDFQRVSGSDSGGHVIMLEVFVPAYLTNGACMRHYVALHEICAKGTHESCEVPLP